MSIEFPTTISPEEIKKIPDPILAEKVARLLEEKNEAENDVEFLNARLEKEITAHNETAGTLEWAWNKHMEALRDHVTGLLQRGELYGRIENFIDTNLKVEAEKLTDEQWLEILSDPENQTLLARKNRYIVFGDISFLSLANKDGHDTGDALLKFISKQVKDGFMGGFRHGGDEITAFPEKNFEEMSDALEKIEATIKNGPEIKIFEDYGMMPNIDFGVADIEEAFDVFNRLVEIDNCKNTLIKLNTLEQFKNIWIEIADKKSYVKKGQTRIAEMMFLYSNAKEAYDVFVNSGRKGGYDITDTEIADLIEKMADNPDDENLKIKLINDFIINREEISLSEKFTTPVAETDPEKWIKIMKNEKARLIWDLVKNSGQLGETEDTK